MYCQINELNKIKAVMMLIGKDLLIPAFQKSIGIPWVTAKMSKFVVLGFGEKANKGAIYYLDGKTRYGTLVIECPLEYILKCK